LDSLNIESPWYHIAGAVLISVPGAEETPYSSKGLILNGAL